MSINTQDFLKLLTNATANGPGLPDKKTVQVKQPYMLTSWGDFDGANVQLQWSPDNGTTWVDAKDCSGALLTVTEPSMLALQPLAANLGLRAVVSSAGGSTNINMEVR